MKSNKAIFQKDYVQRSHERCALMDIRKDQIYSRRILEGQELFDRLDACRDLIHEAEPFLNQLYSFVKGTHFFVLLTDAEGCILSIFGDETILSEAFNYKMMPGAFMDEANIGTNSMGTALAEQMPVQISGDEHYIEAYHRWTCSASPIRDSAGTVIGTLDLTGYSELVHPHTLGMVVAAANAIERMLDVKQFNEELALAKVYTDTIIDSIEAGILTAGPDGTIRMTNRQIPELFGHSPDELKNMHIWQLIDGWDTVMDLARTGRGYTDEEVFVNSRHGRLQFILSTHPIFSNRKELRDIIFVFREVRKVRKLANRIMGRQAVYTFDKILGQNVHFLKVVDFAKKIAESRSSILIMGESGTGKELFAQAIHNRSDRKSESFVALNCGAVPRTIIETELFGYEEGNLSGSLTTGNPGKFEIADGGTLFLDEIGELSLDIQARLLEVIEEGTVCRTGSSKAVDVDVRIIATSNRNLEEEVKRGNFRKDLYYRLNVLPLKLPALRHRKDDIPVLVEFFMQEISERLNRKPFLLSPQQMQQMMRYDWPGNIRELENFIELAINTETMPSELLSANVSDSSGVESQEILSLGEVQKRHILQTLARYNGNISLSAKALGIARNTLYRSIEVHGIDCSEFDAS